MVLKRTDTDEQSDRGGSAALMVETFRSSHESSATKTKGDEDRMSVFWRVFGGTILSIVALAAITLYTTITSNISELRAEVSRLNESKAEWAKKDDVQTLRTQTTTHAGYRAEIDSLKERMSKYRVELDESKKESRLASEGIGKNQAADLARQEIRDAQMKKLDETIKELQKALAETREKIARLEGQQTPMKPKD